MNTEQDKSAETSGAALNNDIVIRHPFLGLDTNKAYLYKLPTWDYSKPVSIEVSDGETFVRFDSKRHPYPVCDIPTWAEFREQGRE